MKKAATVVPAGHQWVPKRWRQSAAWGISKGACRSPEPRGMDHWRLGCVTSAWERFAAADTLVYIDLPLLTHYRWVTKRLVQGIFVNPHGWPEDSPIWSSTLYCYGVVGLCHRLL